MKRWEIICRWTRPIVGWSRTINSLRKAWREWDLHKLHLIKLGVAPMHWILLQEARGRRVAAYLGAHSKMQEVLNKILHLRKQFNSTITVQWECRISLALTTSKAIRIRHQNKLLLNHQRISLGQVLLVRFTMMFRCLNLLSKLQNLMPQDSRWTPSKMYWFQTQLYLIKKMSSRLQGLIKFPNHPCLVWATIWKGIWINNLD